VQYPQYPQYPAVPICSTHNTGTAAVPAGTVHYPSGNHQHGLRFGEVGFSIVAEVFVQFLMLVATAIMTKQQSDIQSSVFNFVELLLILGLDELAVKTTSFTIKSANFNTGQKRDLSEAKLLSSIYFFIGIGIYLLI
jgi:hypothetical protein